MVCRVGGQVGDKLCRVAVMEIGERHDTPDFLSHASATTNHIGNINKCTYIYILYIYICTFIYISNVIGCRASMTEKVGRVVSLSIYIIYIYI